MSITKIVTATAARWPSGVYCCWPDCLKLTARKPLESECSADIYRQSLRYICFLATSMIYALKVHEHQN